MGKDTLIQWCDSTVNPTTGCDGCELWEWLDKLRARKGGPCYAGRQHEGRLARAMPKLYAPDFTEVRLAPGRMAEAAAWPTLRGTCREGRPWLDRLMRLIFVGDMGDVMSAAVPYEYFAEEIMGAITSERGRRHFWLILTKRPHRLDDFLRRWARDQARPLPSNLGVGTSITTRKSLRRLDALAMIPARVRFASLEPLIAPVDISPWIEGPVIDWVIVGGESDQAPHIGRPFALKSARDVVDACQEQRVPVFVKQLGSNPIWDDDDPPIPLADRHGGDWDEWPVDLRVRDFPLAFLA